MDTQKRILIGGGGHALSLIEAMPADDSLAGYVALDKSDVMPVDYLGDDSILSSIADKFLFHVAFVYAGIPDLRKRGKLIELYENLNLDFFSVFADSAVITPNSRLGKGCAVMHNAVVNRASLGNHVIVNTGAIVEHDCCIGNNTFIAPGATLGGFVNIGENCFIGLGAKIKNGVKIASGVTVGMGAIVTHDLDTPGIYHGSPLSLHPFPKK